MPTGLRPIEVDPATALLVVTCSARKRSGGVPGARQTWSADLERARAARRAKTDVDESLLMPAWRRYSGYFYDHAGRALRTAAEQDRLLIISGAYGLARGTEPIGMYDCHFVPTRAQWPTGLLEQVLADEAARIGATSIVAFCGAKTPYANLVRRVSQAVLVSCVSTGGGAMVKVPATLGDAFAAFTHGTNLPADVIEERVP